MMYLKGTKDLALMLSADQLIILKCYGDTAFVVHANCKSDTGMAMTMGQGAIMSMPQKQKKEYKQ